MNIAIFTNNYLPNPYGVTRSVESFRKEFEKNGHTVFIFASQWKGYSDVRQNIYRYPSININIKFRFPLAVPHSQRIDHILEKLQIDIVHAQHPNLLGLTARRWAHKKNIPLIFTWHTLYNHYIHYAPFIPKRIALSYVIGSARRYANKADLVVVPTLSITPILQEWGVTNKHIEVAPTGIEPHLFDRGDREEVRSRYSFSRLHKVLITNMRLSAEKNALFLFDAVIPVLEKDPNTRFIVIGEGDQRTLLEEKIKKGNVHKQVIFIGEISRESVAQHLMASDLFVYASESETQGMVIAEAMFAELPVVAVDATGVCDQVIDHQTGLLVKKDLYIFKKTILYLLNNHMIRKDYAKKAGRIAREKMSSAACAEKLLSIYQRAIDRHRST